MSSSHQFKHPPVPRTSSAAHVFVDVFAGTWSTNDHPLLSPIPDCGVTIVPRSKRNSFFKETDDSFDSTADGGLIIDNKNVRTAVKMPFQRRLPTPFGGDEEKKIPTPFLERQEGMKKDVLSKGRSFLLEQQKRYRMEAKRTKEIEMKEKQAKVEKLQALSKKARQLVHETVVVPGTGSSGHGAIKVNDLIPILSLPRSQIPTHHITHSTSPFDLSILLSYPSIQQPRMKYEIYVDPDEVSDDDDEHDNDHENHQHAANILPSNNTGNGSSNRPNTVHAINPRVHGMTNQPVTSTSTAHIGKMMQMTSFGCSPSTGPSSKPQLIKTNKNIKGILTPSTSTSGAATSTRNLHRSKQAKTKVTAPSFSDHIGITMDILHLDCHHATEELSLLVDEEEETEQEVEGERNDQREEENEEGISNSGNHENDDDDEAERSEDAEEEEEGNWSVSKSPTPYLQSRIRQSVSNRLQLSLGFDTVPSMSREDGGLHITSPVPQLFVNQPVTLSPGDYIPIQPPISSPPHPPFMMSSVVSLLSLSLLLPHSFYYFFSCNIIP